MNQSILLAICAASILAFAATWVAVGFLRAYAPRWGFVDVPNERSSHRAPTPRAGGLAFAVVCPLTATVTWWAAGLAPIPGFAALAAGSVLVGLVGLLDDRRGLPAGVRLVAYVVAAGILLASGGYVAELQWPAGPSLQLGWLGIPLTLLWIVGLTNVYNFMDGIDGLAAVQAIVAAGAVSVIAFSDGNASLSVYAAALAAGVLGFLTHNWPPARIFMGDVGSAFLGYSFAGLAVLSGIGPAIPVPFWAWVVLLAPFIFDASLTLVGRVSRGERWFEAHRQHLYQRLVRSGWSHLAVTTVYLAADTVLAAMVVVHLTTGIGGWWLLGIAALPLIAIYALVRQVESGKPSSVFD